MHEYFRSMYPDNPYISSKYSYDPIENIKNCLINNIKILESFELVGSYMAIDSLPEKAIKHDKQDIKTMSILFGDLWKKRFDDEMLHSKNVLEDLFRFNGLDITKMIKGKTMLDMGCGSGRFSIA